MIQSSMVEASQAGGVYRSLTVNRSGDGSGFQALLAQAEKTTGGGTNTTGGRYLNPTEYVQNMIQTQYGSQEKYRAAVAYHETAEGAGAMAQNHPITGLPQDETVTRSQSTRLKYVQERFPDYQGDGSARSLMEYYMNNFVTDQQKEIMATPNTPGKYMSPCQASFYAAHGRHSTWASQGLHDPVTFLNQNGDPQGNTLYTGSNADAQVLRNMIKGALRSELGQTVTQNKFMGDPFAKGFADDMSFEGHRISADDYIDQLSNQGKDYSWLRDPLSLTA